MHEELNIDQAAQQKETTKQEMYGIVLIQKSLDILGKYVFYKVLQVNGVPSVR
ncbi:hypothetical protein D3C79_1045100 [compost metagenome]